MAVRLYPNTEDSAVLEVLAGVPAGTHAALKAWERKYPDDYSYERWERLWEDRDRGKLEAFIHSGWGRLQASEALMEALGLDPLVGSTQDPFVVRILLDEQGVSVTEQVLACGVSWG